MGMPGPCSKSCFTNQNAPAPNPDPSRWELLEKKEFAYTYVLKVKYLDCTNFEGVKIMVFVGKYRPKTYLDPHFSETPDSPIARIRPDGVGWELACKYAEFVSDLLGTQAEMILRSNYDKI